MKVFSPNAVLNKNAVRLLICTQVGLALLLWVFSPFVLLPKPGEVWDSFIDLWNQGLGAELITSFYLNIQAIIIATVISLLLAYSTVMPFFRPIVSIISKLRFLSVVGLTFFFTLIASGGHELKVSLLVYLICVFFITSALDVVGSIPKDKYDLARTLRMSEWRVAYEIVILGQADQMFDVMRQNAAMGFASITLVESIVRSEGGIGAMLMDQNHHFRLSAVFAIQLTVLLLGLFQDYIIGLSKEFVCPYSTLTLERL